MWGLRFTVACYRAFGRVLSLPLILGVVTYFFATDRKGRAASRAYLERVHRKLVARGETPEWTPGLRQSYRHYRAFAWSIADRVSLWGGQQDRFDFVFHGREHFKKLTDEGRGAKVRALKIPPAQVDMIKDLLCTAGARPEHTPRRRLDDGLGYERTRTLCSGWESVLLHG